MLSVTSYAFFCFRSIKQELENMNKVVGQITPMISKGNKDAMRKLDSIKSSREKKVS